MDLSITKEGLITIVKPLSKNIDATVTTDFKSRITDLIMMENKLFIFNLSNVDFLDSSGLGALISIFKNITLQKGELVLCNLQKPLVSLFKITSMNQVFKIANDENEAIQILKNIKKDYVQTRD